ncbi:SPOSA6832_04212 [Sporobolomyces salmonicolor]|uniref:SPOSA6832_04212-mRNA-1:cds n=1 Tax=Sporidiobolus salmonicolor TaxID=5005 RepID=A0A0D6ES39_SPOSA|nr:SPOSA6832_04212 [Sporobolomyces salmonicolor]
MGGTFDHLHAGHKILLTMACAITSHKLIVGVSDDALLKNKKFKEHLEPLQYRISAVEHFIELVRPSLGHQVVALQVRSFRLLAGYRLRPVVDEWEIQDVYGPTANDPDINALVVSEETRAGGESINNLRASKQLSVLDIWVINLVADDATPPTAGAEPVKVETKMGSTGIREWISKRKAGKVGGTGASVER